MRNLSTEALIAQLNSDNPAERRAAIKALVKSPDRAAIKPLEIVSRADPDLDLRVLALKAANYIKRHAPREAVIPLPELPRPEPDEPEIDLALRRQQELGRFYLNAATNYHMVRDRPRTLENLGKALQHAPDLERDRYVQNMTEQVLPFAYAEALDLLRDATRLINYIESIGGKTKLRRRQLTGADAHKATWANVALHLLALLAASMLVAVLVTFFGLPPLATVFNRYSYNFTARIVERITIIRDAAVGLRIAVSMLIGFGVTLYVVLFSAMLHATAIYMQAGEGTLRYMLRRMARFHIGVLAVGAVTLLALLSLDVTLRFAMLNLFGIVEIVMYVVFLSVLVADVYDFEVWSGCNALFFVGLVLLIVEMIAGLIVFRFVL